MDAVDALRQIKTDDPYLLSVQFMGLRMFNGFASALNLFTSGYYQKSAMIVRDLLETSWLIDLFRLDYNQPGLGIRLVRMRDRPISSRGRFADR